jgi:hypothetical protein
MVFDHRFRRHHHQRRRHVDEPMTEVFQDVYVARPRMKVEVGHIVQGGPMTTIMVLASPPPHQARRQAHPLPTPRAEGSRQGIRFAPQSLWCKPSSWPIDKYPIRTFTIYIAISEREKKVKDQVIILILQPSDIS